MNCSNVHPSDATENPDELIFGVNKHHQDTPINVMNDNRKKEEEKKNPQIAFTFIFNFFHSQLFFALLQRVVPRTLRRRRRRQ